MINKIKDFIKSKLSKRRAEADETLEYEEDSSQPDITNPQYQIPDEDQSKPEDLDYISESRFEELKASISLKLSELSDRFLILKAKLKKKLSLPHSASDHIDSKKSNKQTKELILNFDR
ncbi:MAG TPA: hypothetical protein VKY27_11360, partial [Bacteriovoracaceae bacterium]|nr:hypothetical protein [Bacteriovoracaceae bacterium]